MPMLAVVAVAAAGTAGAVAAGVALATAVTYVGIGMSVVGAITGNKNFSKVGAIMGLAGGVMNIADIGTAAAETGAAGGTDSLTDALADSGTDVAAEQSAAGWDDIATNAANASEDVANGTSALSGSDVASTPATSIDNVGQATAPSAQSTPQGGLLNATPQPTSFTPTTPTTSGINDYGLSDGSAPTQPSGVQSPTSQAATSPTNVATDKRSWWKSLPETTKNEVIKAGLSGASQFFSGWSAQEKAQWEQDRQRELQTNMNAQPTILRYQKPAGLLSATQQKVA